MNRFAHARLINVSLWGRRVGKFSDIGEGDLLAVAERFAIGTAERVLKEIDGATKRM